MSAAPEIALSGAPHEPDDVAPAAPAVGPAVPLAMSPAVGPDRLAVRPARPARPPAPTADQVPVRRSGPSAWGRALRLRGLPLVLLGPLLTVLLVQTEPVRSLTGAGLALTCLVALHALTALLRALGDGDRRRAGPLRRAEAGRAVLGLLLLGAPLLGALTALTGPLAVVAAGAGLALVVVAVRLTRTGHAALAAPLATAAGTGAVWWAATGALPWRLVLTAGALAAVVAAVRTTSRSRVALAGPCAAVGLAVAVHALPWPALLVALSLPLARRAALAGRPATAPGRLALLLLLLGVSTAVVTGIDLPLSVAR